MPCSRSPHSPVRSAGGTGAPPATEAPNSIRHPLLYASCRAPAPCRAISCLFAVTTDFPDPSALRTICSAGFSPPINSITMSTSDFRTDSTSSVHMTSFGTQDCFFLSTLRLQMWVRRRELLPFSHIIFATARPTVPKPITATRQTEVRSLRLCVGAFTAGFEVCLGKKIRLASKGIPYHTCDLDSRVLQTAKDAMVVLR